MSLARVVQPLFWFSKPLGVLPVAFEREAFVLSRLSQLYTVCGAACFLLGGLRKLVELTVRLTRDPFSGQEILTLASNVIVMVFAGLNVYYSAVCSGRMVRMLNDLGRLLGAATDPDTHRAAAQVRLLVFLLQIVFFANYMGITLYELSFKSITMSDILTSTARMLSLTSISCIGSQFCALCLIVRTLVRALNEELRGWLKRGCGPDREADCAERLLELRRVFAAVYDTCCEMNSVFGVFILLILTYHNTFIHVEVFQICAQLIDSSLADSAWRFAHTKAVIWAVINAMKIVAFFVCGGLVVAETKKTGEIVCKYLTKLPAGGLLDSIDCFSRAVAAMKPAFSANGFFAIDWEILFSSASACAINTLILIQSHVNNNYATDRPDPLQTIGSE